MGILDALYAEISEQAQTAKEQLPYMSQVGVVDCVVESFELADSKHPKKRGQMYAVATVKVTKVLAGEYQVGKRYTWFKRLVDLSRDVKDVINFLQGCGYTRDELTPQGIASLVQGNGCLNKVTRATIAPTKYVTKNGEQFVAVTWAMIE